ncbi:hypothetical protein PV10_04359 [Exophiala mesophila]|uniref:Uncharacterized protein n=1 Tax=Exophiala mesophila TaxID=212818 RepID=A0A0D1WUZ3_EXOME|nr:uncharacterized protein PV10_04359 [Exophiala mesophila]KIV93120.1 hypothetical protein PV10_04359 [Exophiala mesophila]
MRRSPFRAVRLPRPSLRSTRLGRRWQSTKEPESPNKSSPSIEKQAATRSNFDRLVARTPRFLRPTLLGLKNAPVSHVTAFFILHELTAIVPLLGLAGAFHYWQWLPSYFAEGQWVVEGAEKFGRYFRKKGWITQQDEHEVQDKTLEGQASSYENLAVSQQSGRNYNSTRWIVELATAYAAVKVLLPFRLALSVWASPWFARWTIIPVGNVVRSIWTR